MKSIYLKSNWSIKKISKYLLITLLPLVLAGFYINGISLYINDYVGVFGLFKPLLISMLGFIIGILVNLIYEYLIRRTKDSFINTIFSSFHPVYGLLIASVISINTNILIFSLVTFILLLFSKYFKRIRINIVALIALIIILIDSTSGGYSFLNASGVTSNITFFNYLFGMGVGGINTTYIILIFISALILFAQDFYKKSIPLFAMLVFTTGIIFYAIFTDSLANILPYLFNYGVIFSFVYLAPDSMASSYTRRGQMIFGTFVGLTTFGLFLVYPPFAALGAILIISIIHKQIDQLCLLKKDLKT